LKDHLKLPSSLSSSSSRSNPLATPHLQNSPKLIFPPPFASIFSNSAAGSSISPTHVSNVFSALQNS